jgi:hypothetical protein
MWACVPNLVWVLPVMGVINYIDRYLSGKSNSGEFGIQTSWTINPRPYSPKKVLAQITRDEGENDGLPWLVRSQSALRSGVPHRTASMGGTNTLAQSFMQTALAPANKSRYFNISEKQR